MGNVSGNRKIIPAAATGDVIDLNHLASCVTNHKQSIAARTQERELREVAIATRKRATELQGLAGQDGQGLRARLNAEDAQRSAEQAERDARNATITREAIESSIRDTEVVPALQQRLTAALHRLNQKVVEAADANREVHDVQHAMRAAGCLLGSSLAWSDLNGPHGRVDSWRRFVEQESGLILEPTADAMPAASAAPSAKRTAAAPAAVH